MYNYFKRIQFKIFVFFFKINIKFNKIMAIINE